MSADETPVPGPPVPSDVGRLIRAGGWAPSGDNTQPWRFAWDPGRCAIEVVLDPSRDPSPMNAGQQMALIACGAAVENIWSLARALGREATLELPARSRLEEATVVARVVLGGPCAAGDPGDLERTLGERVTNRRPYDGRPLDPAVRDRLERSGGDLPGLDVRFVTDRALVRRLADAIARGDAVMFGDHTMRHAFLGNVRFDLPRDAEPEERLPIGSLEASAPERLALRAMRFIPGGLFALCRGARILSAHSRTLVRSASGLCFVVPSGEEDRTGLEVGRAAQRAWLAMTGLGLAAQPMMSLPGLRFALAHGAPELVRSLERLGARQALDAFEALLSSAGVSGFPWFVLRFGYAPPPTCRARRRGSG